MSASNLVTFKSEEEFRIAFRSFMNESEWSYFKVELEIGIDYTRLWRIANTSAKIYFDEVVKISEFLAKVNNGREENGQRILSDTEGK